MSEAQGRAKQSRVKTFFANVRDELKLIKWPSRETVLKELIVVLIISVITGAIIALCDYGFKYVVDFITQIGAAQ